MSKADRLTQTALIRGVLSRRRFLSTASFAALGLAAAACGPQAPAAPPKEAAKPAAPAAPAATAVSAPPSGQQAPAAKPAAPAPAAPAAPAAEKPRTGGILNSIIQGDPPTLDLHQVETYQSYYPVAPVTNLLVQYDPQDHTKLVPDLAQRWEVSADNKVYTFHLVRNAKFHHGKPFKAEDVKASFERIIKPPEKVVSPRRGIFAAVEAIDAVDDYTVRFALKTPNASLLRNIAQGWNAIFPKDLIDSKVDLKNDLIGTGPFKLKNYQRGTSMEFVKNPEYHVQGRPYLDGITYYIIPDSNTIFSAFVSGQLQAWRTSDMPDLNELKRLLGDKVVISKVVDASTHVFEMNSKRKPWDDVKVRRALSLAIDRKAAVDIVTKGEGYLAGIMVPGGEWAISEADRAKIPGHGTDKAKDLEEAKKLLAEANVPAGQKLQLLTRKGPQYEPVSVFLKDQLTKLGFDINLDVQESAAFFDRLNRREFDGLGASYSAAVDDPDAVFGQSWISTAGRNYSGLVIKEIDDLFQKQSETMDFAERKKLVQELETKCLTEHVKMVLARRASWDMQWTSVKNFKAHGSQYLSQRHEDTWLVAG